jgi:DUF1680 family protein
VTGDERWRRIVEAYWRLAVTERGTYATGGQTCGEVWTPPGQQSARLGDKNQEHCVVYNMMRLADYLYRWTGDPAYADYWERNLHNGVLAQQHPDTGMIAYFLPLQPGARKVWGTPTEDFWCCHGTLVQAHTLYAPGAWNTAGGDLVLSQFIPSQLDWKPEGVAVRVSQSLDMQAGRAQRPNSLAVDIAVSADPPAEFALRIRIPWWVSDRPAIEINGQLAAEAAAAAPSSFVELRRAWSHDRVRLTLPKALTVCPLPDQPEAVAFLDGPVVLAGLCDEERALAGDPQRPEALLVPDNEREWGYWTPAYRARGQARGLRFIPLNQVRDEKYTVYFPVQARP